tara:strand:+ start:4690 stop:5094 length:405 start_codon:yes stop_codon:yes gene_type:complete
MKSPIPYKESLITIIILGVLTTSLISHHQQTSNKIKITEKKQQRINQLINTYQTKIKQKTSKDTLIKTITKKLKGTIIKNQIKHNNQHIIIQTNKHPESLIDILKNLKNYYGPINSIAIDLLNQTIELRLPMSK